VNPTPPARLARVGGRSGRRPRIGVAWPRDAYLAALRQAGADPLELRPGRDSVPEAIASSDGLLLTGGVDVDPAAYGEQARHPSVALDTTRDEYELALARAALNADLPLLAICRGAQVLNVAAGGTLIQDIPSHLPTPLAHACPSPKAALVHDVTVAAGSCLSVLLADRLAGGRPLPVNSRHHQSVKEPAPGFIVSATAPDGVIEAIEKPAARFCVGVQWHPEDFWRTGEFSPLFERLVDAARRARRA